MRTAAYARYSTELQSASSIDDQLRNVRGYCARVGWPAPAVYSDAAVSGSRLDRPGYQALLRDAHQFDVILVDDLSRLSRDSIEAQQQVKRLTFAGVRFIGVSDGVDTGRKGHKAEVGLRGIMGELYLDDLRDKTHRGLTGRALAGASAGGLPYGYTAPSTGQRAIDERQAEIVRRIYTDYLSGLTPRAIAAALNRDGVPSPRGGTWAMSAIHGDVRRGIGILTNPIYVGRPIWNRSRFDKHPETGKRVRRERPESEWIRQECPELAIVSETTWSAVQARLRGQSAATGTVGRPPRHLLSGLLRCGECGGAMVVIDRYRYGCATAKDRGTCMSRVRVAVKAAEHALLANVREQFLTEAAFQRVQRQVAIALKQQSPNTDSAKRRLQAAEKVHTNIMAAIRAGILTPSTKAELQKAEADIATAKQELQAVEAFQPAQIIPRLRDEWRGVVAALGEKSRNLPAARSALQSLLGPVIVKTENGAIFGEIAPCQITMVAGAGSVRYLTAPIRIPLT
jgi:site-specific DNA recombinase